MDNIDQSMRFSPTRGVVCRNKKARLAINGKRLNISGKASVARYLQKQGGLH
jgi:hypothetical protein